MDWKKIFSGDLSAYKQHKIKTALLLKDGNVINRVEVFSDKKEIVVSNETGISFFSYDSQNSLKKVTSKDNCFRLSYFKNGMIESVDREQINEVEPGISVTTNFRPDVKNPRSINYNSYFTNTKTGNHSQKKMRYVFNQKDSLLSFYEDNFEKGYVRKYSNRTETRKNINENGFTIDSTYLSNNKEFQYYFSRENEKDLIIKKEDSIYTETYKHGKIETKTVQHNGILYEENFYTSQDIIKKKYFYYLADNHAFVLWEIRKTYKNGKTKSEFPSKRYYDLINQKLIRNKKKFRVEPQSIGVCGGAISEKRRNFYFPVYHICSPSILFSKRVNQRISDNLDVDNLTNELEIIYNKMSSDVAMEKEDYLGENFALPQNFYNKLTDFICRENYIIELKTTDGKTYSRKFTENPQDFSIILNIFETSENQ